MQFTSAVNTLSLLLICGSASAADLTLTFKDLPSDKGTIMVAVYNSEAAYKAKEATAKAKIPANGLRQAVFKDLPVGQYAVTAYHDKNENGSLDKNFMGIPKEAYGFSRNPSSRFGPPAFADVAFTLDKVSVNLEVLFE